jgi:hypothetical protein
MGWGEGAASVTRYSFAEDPPRVSRWQLAMPQNAGYYNTGRRPGWQSRSHLPTYD